MNTLTVARVLCVTAVSLLPAAALAQNMPAATLVKSLRAGGYVLVMRHASSPTEAPSPQAAHPDNPKLERQLDEAGRISARAMGEALRELKIPIGDVLTSPTYRALETVKFANLPGARPQPELGDGGQSMKTATDAQGTWLRERVARLPKGTNTVIVTHMPNLSRAFPDLGPVADGEMIVFGPDSAGGPRPIARIRTEEWSSLRNVR